jgi:hypothetical protein
MDDTERTAAAYRAVLHVNALDQRRKTRFWSPECAEALAQAEATIAQTPGRLLLAVLRRLREGGPQAVDPLGTPTRDTKEESKRPRHGEDGLYDRADMRARRF